MPTSNQKNMLSYLFIALLSSLLSLNSTVVFASVDHDHGEEEVMETHITDQMIEKSNIKTAIAGPQTISITDTLFGVIEAVQDNVFHLHAPFTSMVEKVHVQVGDQVKKGQKLITLKNVETLQRYTLTSPGKGEVTDRFVNIGDRAVDQELLEVTDLSQVWVEMSAFPENIEKLQKGQAVSIYDLHKHDSAQGEIIYVAPQMTGGHIARARAIIENPQGHWRPGMHIKADVEIAKRNVAVAIKNTALQKIENETVAFSKSANTFTAKHLTLGIQSENYVEVLEGLDANTEYVSENSFIIKADLLKDGASHSH